MLKDTLKCVKIFRVYLDEAHGVGRAGPGLTEQEPKRREEVAPGAEGLRLRLQAFPGRCWLRGPPGAGAPRPPWLTNSTPDPHCCGRTGSSASCQEGLICGINVEDSEVFQGKEEVVGDVLPQEVLKSCSR